jgi:hypothetical protein
MGNINTKDYYFNNIWDNYCNGYAKQPDILPAVDRIIVIGDIHGDFNILKESLIIAGLIDENTNWIGGNTVVVQVGDQIDRCRSKFLSCEIKNATLDDEANDWEILNFMTDLHNKAIICGGAVYSLIGNHELMNVHNDFRYVSYEGLKEFEKYKTNISFIEYCNKNNILLEKITGEHIRKWMFSPGNPASNFLACTRKVAIIIGSNLFVHAGILPEIASQYKIKSINQLLTLYLLNKLNISEYKDLFLDYKKSPLWVRNFAKVKDKIKCIELLDPLKKIYNVDNIYVGHTPMMNNGISSLCNNRIWLTDYGASKAFDTFDENNINNLNNIKNQRSKIRNAQVLEIKNDNQFRILK